MTAHAHTEADAALAEIKKLGFKIRQVPGTASGVTLAIWKREKFLGPSTELSVNRPTMEAAAAALLEYARKV